MFDNPGFFRTFLRRSTWFLDAWAGSLPRAQLAGAVPFMCLALLAIPGYYFVGSSDDGARASLLARQLAAAWSREDFDTALLLIERQLQSSPNDARLKYDLARARAANNQHEEAVALMRRLAFAGSPPTATEDSAEDGDEQEKSARLAKIRGGELRAALWLIENEYSRRGWEEMEFQQQHEYAALLEWAASSSPNDLRIQQLYAEALLKSQRYREALPVLVSLIPTAPGIGLRAAIVARGLGEEDRAQRYARESLTQFTKLSQAEPANPALAMAAAQCQLFLRLYPEAFQTIDGAIARADADPQRQQLGQVLAEVIVAWVSALESKAERNPSERLRILRLLQVALQHAPNNGRVLQMVAKQVLKSADDDDQQIAAVRESLTQGTSPGISHFIQGTAAVIKEDFQTATLHLELAAKTLPQSGVILNNLAFVLGHQEDADLERALAMANAAIEMTPKPTPHFFETRGQILVKMERFIDAIPDLEIALAIAELAPRAHQSLAQCYRELGTIELSEQHELAAEKAREKLAASR
jgi:tetratricopeptide (TPR) repeat protein